MSITVTGTVTNLLHAMSQATMFGFDFRQQDGGPLEVCRYGGKWHIYTDADYLDIQYRLERAGFLTVPKERVRGVAAMVARKRRQGVPSI